MATWPNAPRDYDSYYINTWHGTSSKTKKLRIYRDALELACMELARIRGDKYDGDTDMRRLSFMRAVIETIKSEKLV